MDHNHPFLFDVSLSKTGTCSLAEALNILGGFKVTHGCPGRHVKDTTNCLLQGKVDYSLLEEFDTVINVMTFRFRELDRAYPNARFILLDRDEDAWVASMQRQLARVNRRAIEALRWANLTDLLRLLNLGCVHTNDDETLRQAFRQRKQEVGQHFLGRPDKLLYMRITEGWEPLCKFLGRPIPDVPFPWLNATFQSAGIDHA
jgi:hypothetical protein